MPGRSLATFLLVFGSLLPIRGDEPAKGESENTSPSLHLSWKDSMLTICGDRLPGGDDRAPGRR